AKMKSLAAIVMAACLLAMPAQAGMPDTLVENALLISLYDSQCHAVDVQIREAARIAIQIAPLSQIKSRRANIDKTAAKYDRKIGDEIWCLAIKLYLMGLFDKDIDRT